MADNVITITPADTPAVAICRADAPELADRMNRVFPDRGIVYDSTLRDFTKSL